MKPKTKLRSKLLLLISLFVAISFYSCSSDGEEDKEDDFIKIEQTGNLSLKHGENFELILETNITLSHFDNQKYQLQWGNETLKYNVVRTNDNKIKITSQAKYKDQSYPLTIVDKVSGQIVSTGPKLLVERTYAAKYVDYLSDPLLSMCLDREGNIITISGYSFSEIRKRTIKYKGIRQELGKPEFDITRTELPLPLDFDGYTLGSITVINSQYPELDRCGTLVNGGNIYFSQRYGNLQTKEIVHTIIKYDGVSSNRYADGNINAVFKHPVSNIIMNSKGVMFAVEYSVPVIYKLSKEDGSGVWAGSPYEKGNKDGNRIVARFSDIIDMKIDKNDNIYIAEKTKVRKITPDGVVTTLVGTDDAHDIDGTLAATRFSEIKALALDNSGKLYVAGIDREHAKSYIKVIDQTDNTIKSLSIDGSFIKLDYQADMLILNNGIIAIGTHGYNTFNRAYSLVSVTPLDMFD
ncbi:MAG: hypothetical protein QM660_06250 [Dysgonomonas sp.]